MDIQDVEWIGSTGNTLSKLSRIIVEQANEIKRFSVEIERLTADNGRLVEKIMKFDATSLEQKG